MHCSSPGSVEARAIRGPHDERVIVKISSSDDASKETHLCMADYQLVITQSAESQPKEVDLLSSDGDWDRPLSVELSGFSHDAARILGIILEGGPTPTRELFDYRIDQGNVRIADLSPQIARLAPAHSAVDPTIVGTTEDNAIVIELMSPNHSSPDTRWLLDSRDKLHKLSDNSAVLPLLK